MATFEGQQKPVIALTGANGFVGSGIKSWLSKNYYVISLQRRPQDPRFRIELPYQVPDSEAFRAAHVTHLIHCAFDFRPYSFEDHQKANIEPFRRLLENARVGGVQYFILISSQSAYDQAPSLYGQTKRALEKLCESFGGQSLRPGLVYARDYGGLLGKMLSALKNFKIIPLIGNGGAPQFVTQLDDLCRAIEDHFIKAWPQKPAVYFAAHDKAYPYQELLQLFSQHFNYGTHLYLPTPWRAVWGALKTLEKLGLRPSFRSDSVVGLIHSNPEPFRGVERLPGSFGSPFTSLSEY